MIHAFVMALFAMLDVIACGEMMGVELCMICLCSDY
uniref:Uncharacterized protein n=1 Tax=Arundo donax TaxID=35708 RepID=A0A0A8Y5C1_ARUDO